MISLDAWIFRERKAFCWLSGLSEKNLRITAFPSIHAAVVASDLRNNSTVSRHSRQIVLYLPAILILKLHFWSHTGLIPEYLVTHFKITSPLISSRTRTLFFESWQPSNSLKYNNVITTITFDVLKGSDVTISTLARKEHKHCVIG